MQNGQLLAAIDLGSNSFRLEIGVLEHGHIRRVEYLKETVRQGNGLDAERMLSNEAMVRGWECLARFSERLSGFGPKFVRAVATQTLREAKNREEFLTQAEKILGFPIEVISGREEARLIYSGVVNLLPQSEEKRLVIDIGGRSTELIVGKGFKPQTMESYRVGSVKWSMKYFADGQFTPMAFEWAEVAAKAVLDEAMALYPFCRLTGPANVLVMPAAHSASISTKMLQQLGGVTVVGPLLTGLDRPVQIAAMSATTSEILNLAAIAAYDINR